eukprot:TRINITY_DN14213_c0_g1_i1.p1 TRINITY_DN14213_c0_g1~~TRINITY_DN14213_c0_g1_i1.p1  ORF type:complete len:277 (-),score=56.74 TRINITY_DN14213_c0_g1_i1:412-1242(-)
MFFSHTLAKIYERKYFSARSQDQWNYVQGLAETISHLAYVKDLGKKGVGLVASRDVPEGTILWKETPFVVVPEFRLQDEGVPLCEYCICPLVRLNDLVKNTAMENGEDVNQLSNYLQQIHYPHSLIGNHKLQCSCQPEIVEKKNLLFPNLEKQIDEYLTQKKKKTGEDMTMTRLIFQIYLKILQNFTKIKSEQGHLIEDRVALECAKRPISNLMSFFFDKLPEIPILDSRAEDQEWLAKILGDYMDGGYGLSDIWQDFFSYRQYMNLFFKSQQIRH